MNNIIDFDKLKRLSFSRKKAKKKSKVRLLNGFVVNFSWYDVYGDIQEFSYDPNDIYTALTIEGKLFTIEMMQTVICNICKDDPSVAAEYCRLLEKCYKDMKHND